MWRKLCIQERHIKHSGIYPLSVSICFHFLCFSLRSAVLRTGRDRCGGSKPEGDEPTDRKLGFINTCPHTGGALLSPAALKCSVRDHLPLEKPQNTDRMSQYSESCRMRMMAWKGKWTDGLWAENGRLAGVFFKQSPVYKPLKNPQRVVHCAAYFGQILREKTAWPTSK